MTRRRERDGRCPHHLAPADCQVCRRGQALTDVQVAIAELFDRVDTSESVRPAAVPGYRPPTDGRPVPKWIRHRTHAPGLIEQLEDAAGTRPTRGSAPEPTPTMHLLAAGPARGTKYGADITGGGKPGSRPPMSLEAIDTLTQIEAAAIDLRRRADKAAGIPTLTRGRGLRGELRHLTWLLTMTRGGKLLLDDKWAARIHQEIRSWGTDARVTLSYLAPVVTLTVVCPDCGGQLRVRRDATSDVWCTGHYDVEGPALPDERWPVRYRCGAVWPRITWVQLLDSGSAGSA